MEWLCSLHDCIYFDFHYSSAQSHVFINLQYAEHLLKWRRFLNFVVLTNKIHTLKLFLFADISENIK